MSTGTVQQWEVGSRRGWAGTGLLVVLLLVAANAVYGGIGLLVNGMGMPDEWLEPLPVDTWTLPGAALLLTVAVPQLVAAWLVWTHHRWAAVAGVLAGVGLLLWIAVQLLLLQRYFFLQPVIAGLGLVEMLLGWAWVRGAGTREGSREVVRASR
jgi:hypothetical protein